MGHTSEPDRSALRPRRIPFMMITNKLALAPHAGQKRSEIPALHLLDAVQELDAKPNVESNRRPRTHRLGAKDG
jgi:hypothetical protein